ncbi:MAG: hypothetical protein IT392_09810 [Nitrospirae bacterium]|nr:hypothetical protein [Nitrospirota bacterium]
MKSVIVFVPMLSEILFRVKCTHLNPHSYPEREGNFRIRTRFALFLLSVGFLAISIISGCAGKVILSDETIRIRNTVDLIHNLKDLYEQHDESIQSLYSSDFLLESGVKDVIFQDMKRFSTISLNIFIDRIEIDKERANVSVHWSASRGDGEKTFKDGGSSVIIIQSGDGLKIVGIKGDSPFGISNK